MKKEPIPQSVSLLLLLCWSCQDGLQCGLPNPKPIQGINGHDSEESLSSFLERQRSLMLVTKSKWQ